MTHTTLRQGYKVVPNDETGQWEVHLDGCHLCELDSESQAYKIVHAVNTLDEAKAVLQTLVEKFQAQARVGDRYYTASTYDYETIQAVLAKLEGRE